MPPCPGCHRDQSIHAGSYRFFRMAHAGNVVKHETPITLHDLNHLGCRTQRGDDERYAVPDRQLQISLEPGIAFVNDEIDTEGRSPMFPPQAVPLSRRAILHSRRCYAG